MNIHNKAMEVEHIIRKYISRDEIKFADQISAMPMRTMCDALESRVNLMPEHMQKEALDFIKEKSVYNENLKEIIEQWGIEHWQEVLSEYENLCKMIRW